MVEGTELKVQQQLDESTTRELAKWQFQAAEELVVRESRYVTEACFWASW